MANATRRRRHPAPGLPGAEIAQTVRRYHPTTGSRWDGPAALERLKTAATSGGNIFDALMDAVRYCSPGQISDAYFEVGGQPRQRLTTADMQ